MKTKATHTVPILTVRSSGEVVLKDPLGVCCPLLRPPFVVRRLNSFGDDFFSSEIRNSEGTFINLKKSEYVIIWQTFF